MWGAFAIALALAGPAKPSVVSVDAGTCPDLNAQAVGAHIRDELRAAAGLGSIPELPPIAVALHCEAGTVRIRIEDPVTQKAVERTTPAPATDDPDRDRIVALSAVQLAAASWLELLTAGPETDGEPAPGSREALPAGPPPPESIAASVARIVAQRAIAPAYRPPSSPPPTPPPLNTISVVGGVRVRNLRGPSVTGSGALQYGRWLHPRWQILGELGAEGTRVHRSIGRIDALLARLGTGAGFRSRPRGDLRFDAIALVHLVYVDLRGHSDRPDVETARAWGVTGDVSAAFGPTLDTGRTRAGLRLECGYLIDGPVAGVTGDAPVLMHGPWVGAQLHVGFGL